MSACLNFILAAWAKAPARCAAMFCSAVIAAGFSAALPVSAKTLIYCAEASPGGFDPGVYTDGATYAASSQPIYSRLVEFAHGSSDIVPALAESWDISPDGKSYIFHLRKGVKFQQTPYFKPQRDFNADDVVFSFDRQVNKANPWHNYLDGQSYQYYEGMDMNVSYLAYNTQKAPFDKVEVRRALNMAVNKKALVDIVFGGFGDVAVNPLPPSLWGYNKAIEPDIYDPAKARQMLEQAGVKDLRLQLWALPVSRPYLPNGRRAAELIQSDWKAIGVQADIVTMEWVEYLKAASDKNRNSVVMMGWIGDNGDPDNFLSTLNSCAAIGTSNYAMWCNKAYEALIDKAKRIADQQERARLYEQAQVIFKEQAPWLTLAYGTTLTPIAKKVKNFYVDIHGIRFDDVDIE